MDSRGPVTAYIALGSNLGDRAAHLQAAIAALGAAPEVRVVAMSPIYETEAVAADPQPPYLNQVLRVETTRTARDLLELGLFIETTRGRAPARAVHTGARRGARTLDIDLLLYGTMIIDEPGLTVPHPRLAERAFVRIPLADVALPGLLHPVRNLPLDRAASDVGVRPWRARPVH